MTRTRIGTSEIARRLGVSTDIALRLCVRGKLRTARHKTPNMRHSPWTAERSEVEALALEREARRAIGEAASAEAVPAPDAPRAARAPRRRVQRESLLTAKDVGAQLGVSAATVREWVRQGLFPGVRVFAANTLRFPPEAVRAFCERNRIGAKP